MRHLIFCSLLFCSFFAKGQNSNDVKDSSLIIFASDTQAPMWIETLWLKAHHNRAATEKLFGEMANRKPGAVFILGDVVNLGYSNRQWKPMDGYLQSLRSRGIPVHAVLGNHEVMGRAKKGEAQFQTRFPDHVRTGYVQIKDSVAIVLLNSNFKKLSRQEDEKQTAWYKTTLEKLDRDSSIQVIITACHHSPYTNSKIVGSSTEVQQRFVPAFIASKKSRLFLSGHCHGFEHYKIQGKDFMVIGGGGGLHQPLRQGEGCLPDLATAYKPIFHYLTVKRMGGQLQVTSCRLKDDFSSFEEGLSVTVNNHVNGENGWVKNAVTESH
ncbi:MAG TPA: metallophosphoesterase [Flavisolibacter sp.]|nr:metallophosphoesterase [Flavisolibacter sp.]